MSKTDINIKQHPTTALSNDGIKSKNPLTRVSSMSKIVEEKHVRMLNIKSTNPESSRCSSPLICG